MMHSVWRILVAFALLVVLAACGSTPAPTTKVASESKSAPAAEPKAGPAALKEAAASTKDSKPAATSPKSEAKETPKKGGTITVIIIQEPDNLSPVHSAMEYAGYIRRALMEPMVRFNARQELEPALLTEIPSMDNRGMSQDGKTITLHFRKDVEWEDGKPVIAKDFVFTWKAIMNPNNAALVSKGWDQIVSVDTPDDLTAVVRLKSAYAPFIAQVLFSELLPEHILGKESDISKSPYLRKPLSNGPFKLVEWVSGDRIVVERNPNYWRGGANLDKVIFKIIPDANVAIAQAKAGAADVSLFMGAQAPQLKDLPSGLNLISVPNTFVLRIYFNLRNPALQDVRVRQAIQFAVDKEGIASKLMAGTVKPGISFLDNTPWVNPNLKPTKFDPEAGKKLLDEAGWKPGPDGIRQKDGKAMRLTFVTTTGNQPRLNIQQFVQATLKQMGVEVEIKNVRAADFNAGYNANGALRTGKFDLTLKADRMDTDPDPSDYVASDQIPGPNNSAGGNIMAFSDPQIDALLKEQVTTLDPNKRKEIIFKIQERVYDQVPMIIVHDSGNNVVHKPNVRGLAPLSSEMGGPPWNIGEWWLAK
ncbi:MAG: peptide ABC transporter substrate-binding protein [Chloroflexi bacterium]|nr:peptide ABC transporter substrate-binding protein [Chloroflexota bacterium]